MNSLSFVGRLAKDAEVRSTTSGTTVLSFTVANDVGYGDRKITNWYNCTIWGKKAEGQLAQYLKKGQEVACTGEHTLRPYDRKDGTQGYSNDVNVRELSLVGGKRNEATPEHHKPPTQDEPFEDETIPF